MNLLIPTLNTWGDAWCPLAVAVLWQSTLLIIVLLILDFFLAKHLAPSTRYLLWLLVLAKLVIPPSFAAPSGLAWWLRPSIKTVPSPQLSAYGVRVVIQPAANRFVVPFVADRPARQSLRWMGAALLLQVVGSATMCLMLLRQTLLLRRLIATSHAPTPAIRDLFQQTKERRGCRDRLGLLVTNSTVSPALYGLFRPVVVLPLSVIERLTTSELEAILVHEIQHFRRGDAWISLIQTAALTAFWWHPFLWVAHSRTRAVREEAVDQAVLRYMNGASETYAETLLNVARLSLVRNSFVAGFVGMIPSRRALSTRLERIISKPPLALSPSVSVLLLLAFAALLLPMGRAQEQTAGPSPLRVQLLRQGALATDPAHVDAPSGLPSFKPVNKDTFYIAADNKVQPNEADWALNTNTQNPHEVIRGLKIAASSGPDSGRYFTRILKTDPATFTSALEQTVGPSTENETNNASILPRLFKNMGISVSPPFFYFYQDRTGDLILHATQAEIDLIETVVQVLNTPPPMVNIKAKFVVLPANTRALERLPWFAKAKAREAEQPSSSSRDTSSTVISPLEFKQTLQLLEQEKTELLNEANVTTLSGRQTQIQVVDEMTVVNGIQPAALTPPGISSAGGGASASFTTERKQIGPVLDVLPDVLPDNGKITLSTVISINSFLGYDDPKTDPVKIYIDGKEQLAQMPLPHFKNTEFASHMTLTNGSTLVLFSPVTGITVPNAQKTPRKESHEQRAMAVFLTATIIDPAGNPVK